MLFLRALLFFILGTFALAFPIFPDHKSVDADVRQRMAGYWRSPGEFRSPYVVYINLEGQIQLIWPSSRDKWVQVVKVNKILIWTRITSEKEYEGNTTNKYRTEVKGEYEEDLLIMTFMGSSVELQIAAPVEEMSVPQSEVKENK